MLLLFVLGYCSPLIIIEGAPTRLHFGCCQHRAAASLRYVGAAPLYVSGARRTARLGCAECHCGASARRTVRAAVRQVFLRLARANGALAMRAASRSTVHC